MTTPYWSDFVPNSPFTEFWVVSIEHLRRLWHPDRGRLLLRTPGHVPLGLAYVLLVETNPFPNLSLFYRTMLFDYPSVLSRFCIYLYAPMKWPGHLVYSFLSFRHSAFRHSVLPDSVSAHFLCHTWKFQTEIWYIGFFYENTRVNANYGPVK